MTSPDTTTRTEPESSGPRLNEDWIATIVGLVLLAVSLVGIVPSGVIP